MITSHALYLLSYASWPGKWFFFYGSIIFGQFNQKHHASGVFDTWIIGESEVTLTD